MHLVREFYETYACLHVFCGEAVPLAGVKGFLRLP